MPDVGTISPEVYIAMTNPLTSFDVFAFEVGRISSSALPVNLGARPVAETMVRKENLDRLLKEPIVVVALLGLEYHLDLRGENHVSIYIFKHPHLRSVIEYLLRDETGGDFFTWARGKLFGYSEDCIAEFIERLSL